MQQGLEFVTFYQFYNDSASKELEKQGISVEVIDPRTLVPLDKESIVNSVKKTGHLLIVHESCSRAGIGGEILREIVEECFDYMDIPPKILGGRNIPIPYTKLLERAAVPQIEDIVHTVTRMVGVKSLD